MFSGVMKCVQCFVGCRRALFCCVCIHGLFGIDIEVFSVDLGLI